MTRKPKPNTLSRRERQIMDILYKLERASVGHVLSNLADKPSYSTVRAQLRVLEEKRHVRHEEQGLRYVYVPAVPREVARIAPGEFDRPARLSAKGRKES